MRVVLPDGRTFHYSFQHLTTPSEVEYELINRLGLSKHHRLVRHLPKALTSCFIEGDGEETPQPIGMAFCSQGDNFCKEVGRKQSLARALFARFPHSQVREVDEEHYVIRKMFWENYFSRGGK